MPRHVGRGILFRRGANGRSHPLMVEPGLKTEVHLKVEPGLVSALGPEPGPERRVVVRFYTFPEFRFLGVRCTNSITYDRMPVRPDFKSTEYWPEGNGDQCLPMYGASWVFSAPVLNEEVKEHITITPDLAGGRKGYDPWASRHRYSRLRSPHRAGAAYAVRLPERLRAYQRYELNSVGAEFKDEFGRKLKEPVDMAFMISHRDPKLVLIHRKAVLEKQVDSDMPVHVTNLDRLKIFHRALTAKEPKTISTIQSLSSMSRMWHLPCRWVFGTY